MLLLHSGHTSKPPFLHCFSIVSRVLYAIMVPHRSLYFSIVFPSHQFPPFYSYFTWHHFGPTSKPQFFHCFSIVLLHFFIILPRFFHCFSIANGLTSKPSLSIYPSISSIFAVFCHGVTRFLHHYPYVTSVCLTLTHIHLPQSLPLHRINGFARFFHGFISVLLLHSGHTSKPQFFHCVSIPSISVILLLFYLVSFSSHIRAAIFPLFFHCFPPLLHHSPSIFPLLFHR